MRERLRTLLIAATGGAIFSAAAVIIAYDARPALNLEMDRSLPRRLASGFYDTERSGQTTFAGTAQKAENKLAGLNRRGSWACAIRLRGGRADPGTQPFVGLAVDGIGAGQGKATNDFQDAPIVLSPRPSSGAIISLTSSSTLVPGPSDPRPLGIQVDRITCAPQRALVWPPSATIRGAGLPGAIFGCALALVGLTLRTALAAVLMLVTLQALPLASGPAPYVPFSDTVVWFAIWISVATVAVVAMLDRLRPAV